VLKHVYPAANVPIVQLSIDETRPASFHYDIGRRLAPLRAGRPVDRREWQPRLQSARVHVWPSHADPYDWAVRLEQEARGLLTAGDHKPLVDYESLGRDALLSIPTPDHDVPLLYVIGTRQASDSIGFPVEGVDGGSISMLSVRVG
jgi:4,5-DOPA dioxygenase extradiol